MPANSIRDGMKETDDARWRMKTLTAIVLAGLVGGLAMYAYATEARFIAGTPTDPMFVMPSGSEWAAMGYAPYTD